MLRKFHASYLLNAGMSKDDVNCLQGKSRNSTDESYFYDDPKILQEKYISFMGAITINLDVNNLEIKSPEYAQLETELQEKNNALEDMNTRLSKVESLFANIDELSDDELLGLFANRNGG